MRNRIIPSEINVAILLLALTFCITISSVLTLLPPRYYFNFLYLVDGTHQTDFLSSPDLPIVSAFCLEVTEKHPERYRNDPNLLESCGIVSTGSDSVHIPLDAKYQGTSLYRALYLDRFYSAQKALLNFAREGEGTLPALRDSISTKINKESLDDFQKILEKAEFEPKEIRKEYFAIVKDPESFINSIKALRSRILKRV